MLDASQHQICEIFGRRALVLAGPGCGKTHILSRRILHANNKHGVRFSEMLCLTFTNRAAREMAERVRGLCGYVPDDLYVGNLHRFCFRFLLENKIIPPDTGIFDEEDLSEYLENTFGVHGSTEISNFQRAVKYIYETEHNFPPKLIYRLRFPLSSIDYERVAQYIEYKRAHRLIDFDEMIYRTYQALSSVGSDTLLMSAYSWIQIDEVQDMTPMQLAIVNLLLNNSGKQTTCLYLGDEQQAIFSFIGAGGEALKELRETCRGNIYHLARNYRSAKNLVELCNSLAANYLDVDSVFLPNPVENINGEARLVHSSNIFKTLIEEVRRLRIYHPSQSVAILTHTNAQADKASEALSDAGINNIRLAKSDLFRQPSFKTLFSHLAVCSNPFRREDWARLLYKLKCLKTMKSARNFTSGLMSSGIGVHELLCWEQTSILQQFCSVMRSDKTIACIDTETTGLDIFNDDIIQFAGIKMKNGEIVEGSEFVIFISTLRNIPRNLSDSIVNPLLDTYKDQPKLSPENAIAQIINFLEDVDVVMGHNLDFDLSILENYIQRHSNLSFFAKFDKIDTLDVARLALPSLKSYRLEELTEYLGIKKVEFHLASEDVRATVKLANNLYDIAESKQTKIREIKSNEKIAELSRRLSLVYKSQYEYVRKLLHSSIIEDSNSLVGELERFYKYCTEKGFIRPIDKFNYLKIFISEFVVDPILETNLRTQTQKHLHDLLTFNEGDLYTKNIINEHVSVMTIHKAKGLEMDNVILFTGDKFSGSPEERAKVLYVAFSRPKRQLIVISSGYTDPIIQFLSSFFKK